MFFDLAIVANKIRRAKHFSEGERFLSANFNNW